jgi:CHAD domain-containing protein
MQPHKVADRQGDSEGPAVERDSGQPTLLGFPRLKPDDAAGDVVVAAFRGAVSRISASDPEARRGDAEGIHRLRTSTRRLRSELKALEVLIDRHWREPMEEELKWLAGLLGKVRDLDILLARLKEAAPPDRLDGDGLVVAPLLTALHERHELATRALFEGLQGERYRALLTALHQAVEHPDLTDAAWEPCSTALPPLADAAWRRLKKGARSMRPSDPVEDFHELRKRAKFARYTAELIAPVLGPEVAETASQFVRLTTRIQSVLGDHQDATVSIAEIDRALEEHCDDSRFAEVAGRLLKAEQAAARAARASFFTVWDKLDRKKVRRWMKTRFRARAQSGA